jgi:hypothetical protein
MAVETFCEVLQASPHLVLLEDAFFEEDSD